MSPLLTTIVLACAVCSSSLIASPDPTQWEELAEQGDVRAMLSLGIMHHSGDGVKADYSKAMDWYLLAYAEKDGDALNNIGVLFRDGLGVPQNELLAYLLFLAVHMEGLGTEGTQMRAGRNLGRLAETLERDQIHQALSYTWQYVDQLVVSRGEDTEPLEDVLPSAERVRIRDNNWWLDSEKQQMTFESPAPWDDPGTGEQDGGEEA